MNDKNLSPAELEVSPYQPPVTPISSLENEEQPLAGRSIRFLANLADGLIFIIPTILALSFITPFFEEDVGIVLTIGITLIIFVVAIVIINLLLLYENGQTIGKRLLSIKVVRTNGNYAGLLRIIFLRFLPTAIFSSIPLISYFFALFDPLPIFQIILYHLLPTELFSILLRFLPTGLLFISFLSIFALLDSLLIFQKSRRCLHDLIADTVIIKATQP